MRGNQAIQIQYNALCHALPFVDARVISVRLSSPVFSRTVNSSLAALVGRIAPSSRHRAAHVHDIHLEDFDVQPCRCIVQKNWRFLLSPPFDFHDCSSAHSLILRWSTPSESKIQHFSPGRALARVLLACSHGERCGSDPITNSSARGRVDLHPSSYVFTEIQGMQFSSLSSVRC